MQELKKKKEKLEREEEKLGAFGMAGIGLEEMIENAGVEESGFGFADEEGEGFELDLGFD